jgi:endonuclease YncB( thermonuclease family)
LRYTLLADSDELHEPNSERARAAYGADELEERAARNADRGIWSSRFEPPAAWRAKHPREK